MFELIDEFGFKIVFWMLLALIFLGISPVKEDRLEKTGEIFMAKVRKLLMVLSFTMTICLCTLLWYIFRETEITLSDYLIYKLDQNKWAMIGTGIISFVLKVLHYRYLMVWWSNFKKRWVNQIDTEKLSDITETLGQYVAPKYNPLKYVDLNKGIFVGMDAKSKKPIYISIEDFKECHKEIIGASRSGKGVSACVLAYQKIKLGWGLFYIDPKPDKFVPRVLYKACKEAGKKLLVIDFVEGKAGQYAPFRGGTLVDIKARVKQVFKIRRTGGDADFYKGQEINLVDMALNDENRGTKHIYDFLFKGRPNPEVATGIEDVFKELIEIDKIVCKNGAKPKKDSYKYWNKYIKFHKNGIESKEDKKNRLTDNQILYPAQPDNRHVGGISIARAIMEGSVVYIRGDTVDVNIRSLVKLILTEITQEVKRLYPFRAEDHVSIDMDEGKFVMSEILSDSMATIAGFGCDMTVQYQALEDIETSIEKDIDMKALAAALHINTQIKLIHGGLAPRTAEYLMEQSGTRIKKITAMDRVSIKELGAEQWSGEKMVRDQEEALLTQNDFLSMGKLTFALLQRSHISTIAYSAFVDVGNEPIYNDIMTGIAHQEHIKKKNKVA